MALHFVQVERALVEGVELCEAAQRLGLPEDELLGKVVRFLAWSLEHAAPYGLVVGGPGASRAIERAADWRGEPGAFVAALAILFDVQPNAIRIKGWLERYGKELRRQEADALRKAAVRSKARPTGRPSDSPQDIQPEEEGSSMGHPQGFPSPSPFSNSVVLEDVASSGSLPVTREPPLPPAPEDRFESGAAFFAWAQHERRGAGFVTERTPAHLGSWFSEAMMELNGDGERLQAALEAFAEDAFWRRKNCPFTAFMKRWRDYTPRKAVGA